MQPHGLPELRSFSHIETWGESVPKERCHVTDVSLEKLAASLPAHLCELQLSSACVAKVSSSYYM
eukprot:960711-Amphidinium_carterae.1